MIESSIPRIAYCGAPPSPEQLWSRWNGDPILIGVLILLLGAYATAALRQNNEARVTGRKQQACFYLGWAVTSFALVSPLCALSVSLFSARVLQHAILLLLAAPLLALGRPVQVYAALFSNTEQANQFLETIHKPVAAAISFTVVLWIWHAPYPYAMTFVSSTTYWLMHVSLIASALWLWSSIINCTYRSAPGVIFAGIISSAQMGFLGAIILFAQQPLYSPHAITTAAWGLSQLQDQQLGGGIMWVPGCIVFLVVAVYQLYALLRSSDWDLSQPAVSHHGNKITRRQLS